VSFLLDTNVVSEWVKARPDTGVITWLAEADEDRVFLSVVTLAELRYGIERMPTGARQKRLNVWLTEELTLRFEGSHSADRCVCGRYLGASRGPQPGYAAHDERSRWLHSCYSRSASPHVSNSQYLALSGARAIVAQSLDGMSFLRQLYFFERP
jgi:predicted nucleic acid-binding protein